jgi:hypothetical protein
VADLASAFDARGAATVDAWLDRIHGIQWISDEKIDRFVGPGPLITDDRPYSEYFLLRRTFGEPSPLVGPGLLQSLSR